MSLTLDDAEKLIIEFCATYPVASTIKYKLRETQEELYGQHITREAEGIILGSFHPGGGRALFATSNFRDESQFRRTLRHEILGHFGINTFRPEEKRAVLARLTEARNEPGLVNYWSEIDRLYAGLSDMRKAEEVFAFVCEEIDPEVRSGVAAGIQSFNEICVERSRPMQLGDLVNLTTLVAEGMHDQTRSQQNFPATDNDQFKLEKTTHTSEYPVWLAVPHEARDAVREAAGRMDNGQSSIAWDKEANLWFARPGADLDRITQWLPDTSMRAGGGDPEAEFLDALTQEGLIIQGMPVMDGQRHRVATVEDKSGKKSGVYRGFLDRRPAGWLINYHRAETEKSVTNWRASGGEADPVARLHIRAAARQSQEDAVRARAQLYAQKTAAAKKLYDRLPAADPAHPYLVRKGISPTPELRQTRNGALVVPFFNVSGTFKTLQYIPPDGEKFLFKDAPKQGHFLIVGGVLSPGHPVLYAEGYATARSLNVATGLPVVMSIDAGNMVAVARVLQEQLPGSAHVFFADFDHANEQNKGLLMATAAAELVGGRVLYPEFTDEEKALEYSDFNDLHQSRGLDALRSQVLPVLVSDHEVLTMQDHQTSEVLKEPDVVPAPLEQPSASVDPLPPVEEPMQATDTPEPVLQNPPNRQLNLDVEPPASEIPEEQGAAIEPLDLPPLNVDRLPSDEVVTVELTETPEPVLQDAQTPSAPLTAELPPVENEELHVSAPPGPLPDEAESPIQTPGDLLLEAPPPLLQQQAPLIGVQPGSETVVDAIVFGPPRPHGVVEDVVPGLSSLDRDALIGRLEWEKQPNNSILYKLDGAPAFVDLGMRLEMAPGASQNDEMILAALLTAIRLQHGRIELTGSEAFQAKAIDLIAQHQLDVAMKNPAQQTLLDDARALIATQPVERDAIVLDTAPLPEASPSQQPAASLAAHNPTSPPLQPSAAPAQTPAQDEQPPMPVPDTAEPKTGTRLRDAAVHQHYEAAKDGVVGKVIEFGTAPFRFDKENDPSTYIKLRTRAGTQTFWGKELAGLLRDTRVQTGNMVNLQWLGKEEVTIKVPRKDKEGVTYRFDDKQVHRNQWALTVANRPAVRSGQDEGVKLAVYDAARFAAVQQAVIQRFSLDIGMPPSPVNGLYWMTPNGQGSAKAGDELSAPRPAIDPKMTAGHSVISSWSPDGRLDMHLVRGDGPYLQGVVRQGEQLQHVLVSLPGSTDAPPMVFNAITPEGLVPIGTGNGINRSGGESVSREHIAFRLEGDTATRVGKLDAPADLPPALHARLGFDERWKEDNNLPKSAPTAAPSAQPNDPRPA